MLELEKEKVHGKSGSFLLYSILTRWCYQVLFDRIK